MPELVEDMVFVRPSGCIICGGGADDDVMVCDLPEGGPPKILEKAASRW
jgi:hypothetical protein